MHDVGVGLCHAIGADVPVDIEISAHAALDELAPYEVTFHRNRIGLFEFSRQCELDLAGELRILAHLCGFDGVPRGLTRWPQRGNSDGNSR